MTQTIDVEVTGASTVELFSLRMKPDSDQFIVGRPATGAYLALSRAALSATELLRDGLTVEDTKQRLRRRHPGEPVRLAPLLQALLETGMVKSVNGGPLADVVSHRRYHLTFLQPRHVGWLFSRPAAVIYLAIVSCGLGIVLTDPGPLPRPGDLVAASNPWLALALLTSLSVVAMTLHELAHLAAATVLGVRASIGLSNRLVFPVAQTDLTDLWLVDRRRRYLAYTAGMINDLLWASLTVIALWLLSHHSTIPALLAGTLRLFLMLLLCGLLWQFNFYLRTDVYYLLANATGCRNLYRDASRCLKAWLSRLFMCNRPDPLRDVPANERRVVRAFAVFLLLGPVMAVSAAGCYFAAHQPGLPSAEALPVLPSLVLTSCLLGWSVFLKRRRQPRVQYRLVGPDDL